MTETIERDWQDTVLGIGEQGLPAPAARRVIRYLLRGILAGRYAAGARIREVELAEALGVSRAPVREALRILEQEGLIESTSWRGARVIDPTPEEIANQFELLATIYGSVARFAVKYANDRELEPFFNTIRLFEQELNSDRELVEIIEITYRMGAQLGQCCGSRLAAELLRKLGRICYLQHRHLSPMPKRWMQQSLTRLAKLERAIRERSEEKAEKAARRLINNTASLVLMRIGHTSTKSKY